MANEYGGWGNQIILGVDKDGACALNSICLIAVLHLNPFIPYVVKRTYVKF